MRMRRALLVAFTIALVLIILLVSLSLREYYVAIALTVGVMILTRRELWHLIKKRKLPPFDERVRASMGKSARNGFIFFAVASASLMLFYAINLTYIVNHNPVHVMSGLFLAGGLVYLLSYVFYDRVEPKLDETQQLMCLENPLLGIDVFAYTRDELDEELEIEIGVLWRNYAIERDEMLSPKAKELKYNLLNAIDEVKNAKG